MSSLRQKVEGLIEEFCFGGLMGKAPSRKGLQLLARCPFHKDGKEEHPSFYWNSKNGMWHCQSCKAGGTFPTFLKMTGTHPDTIQAILEEVDYLAAIDLSDDPFRRNPLSSYYAIGEDWVTIYTSTPCPLEHSPFNPSCTMSPETLRHFQIGFDPFCREVMFPVRAWDGNLTSFSGRAHGWDRKARYLFRSKKLEMEYPDYFFDKSFHLWNFHNLWVWSHTIPNIDRDPPPVILVEGFKVAMYLHQIGYPFVVSAFGSSLHEVQRYLLSLLGWPVVIFFDNDAAGVAGTKKARRSLSDSQCLYRSVNYYPGMEGLSPDDLNRMTVYHLLEGAYAGITERHGYWGNLATATQPQEEPGCKSASCSTAKAERPVNLPSAPLLGPQLRTQGN